MNRKRTDTRTLTAHPRMSIRLDAPSIAAFRALCKRRGMTAARALHWLLDIASRPDIERIHPPSTRKRKPGKKLAVNESTRISAVHALLGE